MTQGWHLLTWGGEHSRQLSWVLAAVVTMALLVTGFLSLRNARLRQANDELGRALGEFRSGQYTNAATQLGDVASRWQSTAPGRIAVAPSLDYEAVIAQASGAVTDMVALTRHWQNCDGSVAEIVVGTKRESNCSDNLGQPLANEGENGSIQEHLDLINSITGKGRHYNEAMQVAESSFTAILGRESAYSGKRLTWDALLNSGLDILPKPLSLEAKLPTPLIPVPGEYQIPGLAAEREKVPAARRRPKA